MGVGAKLCLYHFHFFNWLVLPASGFYFGALFSVQLLCFINKSFLLSYWEIPNQWNSTPCFHCHLASKQIETARTHTHIIKPKSKATIRTDFSMRHIIQQYSTSANVWKLQMRKGGMVSLQQRRDGVRVTGKARGADQECVMVFTVWQLHRSFTNQIKENDPHFNPQSKLEDQATVMWLLLVCGFLY